MRFSHLAILQVLASSGAFLSPHIKNANANARQRAQAALYMTGDFAYQPTSSDVEEKALEQKIKLTPAELVETITFERKSTREDENCDAFFTSLLTSDDDASNNLGPVKQHAWDMLHRQVDPVIEFERSYEDEEFTPYHTQPLPGTTMQVPKGFQTYGLPIVRPKYEAWRYFNVREWMNSRYETVDDSESDRNDDDSVMNMEQIQSLLEQRGAWLNDDQCHARLIYVDGAIAPELSKSSEYASDVNDISEEESDAMMIKCLQRLPDGFTEDMAYDEIGASDHKVGKGDRNLKYAQLSGPDQNVGNPVTPFAMNSQSGNAAFCALNSVKAQSVAHVNVPDGKVIEDPIVIVHVASNDVSKRQSYPRTLIRMGAGSEAPVQQFTVDLSGDNNSKKNDSVSKFQNSYTQVYLQKGSKLDHNVMEDSLELFEGWVDKDDDARAQEAERVGLDSTSLSHIDAHVASKACYSPTLFHYSSNGRCRTILQVSLLERAAECGISSINLSGGLTTSQQDFKVHHVECETVSKQNQKTLCGGRSVATFRGAIRVEQEGQQADAEQLAKNILVSDRARVWAIPSLEIIADDVTCTHGATVSDLSEEELFYLRSRGLNRQLARNLLMSGFVDEICQNVNGANAGAVRRTIRTYLERLVPKGDREVKGEFQSS